MARDTSQQTASGGPPPPSMSVVHKGCTSASCCSPARLWRTLQTIIKSDKKKDLIGFFNDERREHIVRVALTARLSNDASQLPPSQKHTVISFSHEHKQEAIRLLGKPVTDLNALQLALMCASEPVVLTLLSQLKLYASPGELRQFVNHLWGQGNTSLHLACFLKRTRVVKLLLSLGAHPDVCNARNISAAACCEDSIIMSHKKCTLKQQKQQQQKDETLRTIIPNDKNSIIIESNLDDDDDNNKKNTKNGSSSDSGSNEKKQMETRVLVSTGMMSLFNEMIKTMVMKQVLFLFSAFQLSPPIRSVWLNPLKKPPDKQTKIYYHLL